MKHQNITFSIPEDLKAYLQTHVRSRSRSRFISTAIRKALDEEKFKKEKDLDAAYEAANSDVDRLEVLKDWDFIDDVYDLVDDEEDWSWLNDKT